MNPNNLSCQGENTAPQTPLASQYFSSQQPPEPLLKMRLSIEIHKATRSGGACSRQMWLLWLLSSHSPRLTLVPQAINYLPLPPPRWQAASFNFNFLYLSFSALFPILSSPQLPNPFPLNKGLIDTYLINIWAFVLSLYFALKIAASISDLNKGLHTWKFAWYFQQCQLIQ